MAHLKYMGSFGFSISVCVCAGNTLSRTLAAIVAWVYTFVWRAENVVKVFSIFSFEPQNVTSSREDDSLHCWDKDAEQTLDFICKQTLGFGLNELHKAGDTQTGGEAASEHKLKQNKTRLL